jgi:transposase-like protein
MRTRAEIATRKQAEEIGPELMRLLLPITTAIAATKKGLMELVHRMGLAALDELLRGDAEKVAGQKGRRDLGRTRNHWGTTPSELTFGGRRVRIARPRVRDRLEGEVALPMWEVISAADQLPARVEQQIALGVSTRRYADSLEPLPTDIVTRGTSKSAASRALIGKTKARLRDFLSQRLDDLELVAMFIDGIELGGATVVVALGLTSDGSKIPLGLWQGSTENAALGIALLNDLIERGLCFDGRMLFVIDGGKGIRKALTDVFGDRAVVQRCQVHKRRNVRDQVSVARRPYVQRLMNEAYRSQSAETARGRLRQLASWLENNGEPGAAASIREGLEETLTVLKLRLPKTLQRTLATTNPVENINGAIRRVTRNVKRWRNGPSQMITRWAALGIAEGARRFRRIKGHKDLPILVNALRALDQAREAA